MTDSNGLLLLGVGILIGLGFVTVLLLVQRPQQVPAQTAYVQIPSSLGR